MVIKVAMAIGINFFILVSFGWLLRLALLAGLDNVFELIKAWSHAGIEQFPCLAMLWRAVHLQLIRDDRVGDHAVVLST